MKRKLMLLIIIMILPCSLFAQTTGPEADFTYAQRLYTDQMFELAAIQFHEFSEKYPDSPRAPEALELAGDAYSRINNYERARNEYVALLLKYPDVKGLDEIQYKIGQSFEKEENFLKAAHSYQHLHSLFPNSKFSEDILYDAARMYVKAGQFQPAIELFYLYLDRNDQGEKNLKARYELARTFLEMGEYERGVNEINKILSRTQLGKTHINSSLTKAEIEYRLGRINEASRIYEKILSDYDSKIAQYPVEVTKARLKLASIQRANGKYDRAKELLAPIGIDNLNMEEGADLKNQVHLLKGDTYYDLKQYQQAIQQYELYSADNTDASLMVQNKLGKAFYHNDQLRDARSMFESLITECDTLRGSAQSRICQDATYHLAMTYLKANEPSNALFHLNQFALKYSSSPCLDEIKFKTAKIHENNLNNPERALRLYYDFVDQFPASRLVDDGQLAVARCYEKMNDYSAAIDEYSLLIKNFVGSMHVDYATERVTYLTNYFATGQKTTMNTFASLLSDVIEESDKQGIQYKLALTYFNDLKNYEQAIDLFKEAEHQLNNSVNYYEIQYYIGRSYQLLAEKQWLETGTISAYKDSAIVRYNKILSSGYDGKWRDDVAYNMLMLKSEMEVAETERDNFFISFFPGFIDNYPQSDYVPDAIYRLAESYFHTDNTDSVNALTYFRRLIDTGVDGELGGNARYHSAMIHKNRGEMESARDILTTVVNQDHQYTYRVAALYELAKIKKQMGEMEEAKKDFETVIDSYFYSPYADSAISQLGNIYLKTERYSEGYHYFKTLDSFRASKCGWSDESERAMSKEIFHQMGQLYSRSGDKKKAVENFQTYLTKFPGDQHTPTILFRLAELYQTDELRDDEIALDYLNQLIDEYPQYDEIGDAYINAGDLLFADENYPEARNYYLSAMETVIDDSSKLHSNAQAIICLYLSDKVDEGDQETKQFDRNYDDIDEYLGRIELAKGDYYFKKKEFQLAEKIYKSSRSKFKRNIYGPRAELALGRLYLTLNRDEDALKILTEMPGKYEDHPVIPDVYLALGEFYYMKARQVENAMLAYKNAIDHPQISDASLSRGMSSLIRCYFDLKMWDQVLSLSRQYLEKFPLSSNSFEVRVQIGITYYYLHEYDRAIKYLTTLKYEADNENEPRIQYWIGDCYMEKGQYQKAIIEYLKVKYISKPSKLNWAVTAQYKAGLAYMKLGNMDAASKIFKKIIIEQGAASPFGKGAQKKLDEIEQLNNTMSE